MATIRSKPYTVAPIEGELAPDTVNLRLNDIEEMFDILFTDLSTVNDATSSVSSFDPAVTPIDLTTEVTGILPVPNGGTGIDSYAVGDILYASAATTLSKLVDVATGNALISGGVTTAPAWGKIGLTTHVTGTLGVTNGGTGLSSLSTGDILYASAANTLSALAKDTNASRYLSNQGASNIPAWQQVNLANGVTGNLSVNNLNSGTSASATTFWRGDGSWAALTASVANALPAPFTQHMVWAFPDHTATTANTGTGSAGGTGLAGVNDSSGTRWQRISSLNSANARSFFSTPSIVGRMDMDMTMRMRIRTDASNTSHTRYWIGFSANGAPANSTNPGVAFVGLRVDTEDGDTTWTPLSSQNGAGISTGTPFGSYAANTEYEIKIVISGGGTSAEFFVNGVSGGSLTSAGNWPAVSQSLTVGHAIFGIGAGVTRVADAAYFYAETPAF